MVGVFEIRLRYYFEAIWFGEVTRSYCFDEECGEVSLGGILWGKVTVDLVHSAPVVTTCGEVKFKRVSYKD